jgi:hypothetical protein
LSFVDELDSLASAQFTGDSMLERISRAYEEAIDAAGNAYDAEAVAENEYRRLHAVAWAHAVEDGIAATVRDKHCNAQKEVCEALQEWNRAVALRKRCADKARELENRLGACQSHMRFVREAT